MLKYFSRVKFSWVFKKKYVAQEEIQKANEHEKFFYLSKRIEIKRTIGLGFAYQIDKDKKE